MKNLITALCLISSLNYQAQVPSYVPTNGLVGWWPFNGNANDESGNGNHGVVLAGVFLVQDRYTMNASAYSIDGVSCVDKRGIEIPAIVNQNTDYSVSCWFKISNINQDFQTIFCSNPHNTVGLSFNHPFGPNILSSGLGNGSNWIVTGQDGNTFNCDNYSQWNHILLVKQSQEVRYYINGVLARTQPINNLNSNVDFTFDFGTIDFSAWGCYETLNGSIDDIGIWTRALTEPEIIALHASLNVGIDDLGNTYKKLLKITDLNGKSIPLLKNTLMLFIYEDGSVERVVEMEE
jgi:Concanavalin A-like lectin/glucanases superfamily